MASIRKRTWQAGDETRTAWVANYSDGEGKRRLKTFKTKRAADAWLVTARGEVADGVHVAERESATIAKAAGAWLEDRAARGRETATIKQYRSHVVHHIVPALGTVRLHQLSESVLRGFETTMLQRNSRQLTRKVIASLKATAKHSGHRKARNIIGGVDFEKDVRRHQKRLEIGVDVPTRATVGKLLAATEGSPRWHAFVALAAFTGLRSSELRGLEWRHVDFERRLIAVRQRADENGVIGSPKSGGSRRDVPLTPVALAALKAWRLASRPGAPFVFGTSNDRPGSHANILRSLRPIMREAGVEPFGLHGFRHFYASLIINAVPAKRAQMLLGHGSIQMTFDRYGHWLDGDDDHARLAAIEASVAG